MTAFTSGINPDSNTLSVGPRIKSDASGRVQVGPIEGLRHLPPHVIRCVKVIIGLMGGHPAGLQRGYPAPLVLGAYSAEKRSNIKLQADISGFFLR